MQNFVKFKLNSKGKNTLLSLFLTAIIVLSLFCFSCSLVPVTPPPTPQPTPPPTPNPPPTESLPEAELNVYYLNVGQGDCILICFPDGKTMLMDSGSSAGGSVDTVTAKLDELNIKTIDYVLLTHVDSDHCKYIADVIAHVEQVKCCYLPKIKSSSYDLGLSKDYKTKDTNVYNETIKACLESTYIENEQSKSAEIKFTVDEVTISGTGYTFTMYCRSDQYYLNMKTSDSYDINDVSPICVLEFRGRKLIFAGDANNTEKHSGEHGSSEGNFLEVMNSKGITDENFDADVLKVAHHGSSGSSGDDFLGFIDVEYAVVSVGGNPKDSAESYNLYVNNQQIVDNAVCNIYPNRSYEHPSKEVCSTEGRLKTNGVQQVYYTWFNGTIKCNVDTNGNITFNAQSVAVTENGVITFTQVTAVFNVINTSLPTIKRYYI